MIITFSSNFFKKKKKNPSMPDVSVTNADRKMGVSEKNTDLGTYRKAKKGNYIQNSKT
jgi:hypothetical protein